MITAWMLYSLLIGAMLSAGALLIDRLAASAGVARRGTWFGALIALVVLTALAPWRAATSDSDNAGLAVAASTSAEAATASQAIDIFSIRALASFAAGMTINAVSERVPGELDRTVGALWVFGSALGLLSVFGALIRMDRQRRGWPHATMLGHRVRVSKGHGPAVYGVLDPEIVLPSVLLGSPDDDQKLVLAHEDEHRRARDPLLMSVSALLVALIPWNPVAWWFAARVRLAVELDCDLRVLRRGASPRRYGELLLALANSMPPRRSTAVSLALFNSIPDLERRLIAMTSTRPRRTPLTMAAFVLVSSSVIVAACATDVPTAAQIRDADATSVAKELRLQSDNVVYTVDGVLVDESTARALKPEEIASIEVRGRKALVKGVASGEATEELDIVDVRARQPLLRAGMRLEQPAETEIPQSSDVNPRGEVTELRIVTPEGSNPTVLRRDGSQAVVVVRGEDVAASASSETRAANTQPLFIVDGVIVRSGLKDINPERIESIEVVKGQMARSIWGERAQHGVISIKLKP